MTTEERLKLAALLKANAAVLHALLCDEVGQQETMQRMSHAEKAELDFIGAGDDADG